MRIEVNGTQRDTEASTLAALWDAETKDLGLTSRKGFAIARNGEVVRAPAWEKTRLVEGDRVEIIRAMAGG